jgi:periplasmic divalent cation tolerance protein
VGVLIVVTTVGSEEQANLVADELVVRRHAACVNIIRVQRSVYRWQGRVFDDNEYLLLAKTTDDEYPAVEVLIRELSNYDQPEILGFEVSRGEAGFLQWIAASLDKDADFSDDIEPR